MSSSEKFSLYYQMIIGSYAYCKNNVYFKI